MSNRPQGRAIGQRNTGTEVHTLFRVQVPGRKESLYVHHTVDINGKHKQKPLGFDPNEAKRRFGPTSNVAENFSPLKNLRSVIGEANKEREPSALDPEQTVHAAKVAADRTAAIRQLAKVPREEWSDFQHKLWGSMTAPEKTNHQKWMDQHADRQARKSAPKAQKDDGPSLADKIKAGRETRQAPPDYPSPKRRWSLGSFSVKPGKAPFNAPSTPSGGQESEIKKKVSERPQPSGGGSNYDDDMAAIERMRQTNQRWKEGRAQPQTARPQPRNTHFDRPPNALPPDPKGPDPHPDHEVPPPVDHEEKKLKGKLATGLGITMTAGAYGLGQHLPPETHDALRAGMLAGSVIAAGGAHQWAKHGIKGWLAKRREKADKKE